MSIGDQKFLERLPLATDRPVIAYGVTLLFVAASFLLRELATAVLPPGFPFVTFFPAVILSAFLFGLRPGIVAAILCGAVSTRFFVPTGANPFVSLATVTAMVFYALVVVTDIALVHWMQRANRRLSAERARSQMLADKGDLLFRELQHRVSNNIQVVAALLALQKRNVGDETARAALDEASRRLGLIGKIHRQLHDPSGERLGLGDFLRQLGADLIDAGGKPGIACTIEADETIRLDPDAAVPVALIVAEAVNNALEHGFGAREEGNILIRLHRPVPESTVLIVADDGAGLPQGFDLAGTTSLGLRIAQTLARQIGGTFEMLRDGHTVARLTLPA